mmetsp:Transcript_81419/g.174295  ORF Transcript_81419/g.174295 Transcript_81419/m.174295 type:complete len:633 (-) Transcript_81419:201-2099(-)
METNPDKYALPTEKGSTHLGAHVGGVQLSEDEWRKRLSPNQFSVLRLKSTEPGHRIKFPDGFDDHYDPGVYLCGSCAAAGDEVPLYTSKMKFDCGCGWPGFWTNVKGAVYEQRDSDGKRCEILCARCDGHLGHVFRGEPFGFCTSERHCVNSMSLIFAPALGLRPGALVRIGDLKSAPQHNGKVGKCGKWIGDKGRWAVQFHKGQVWEIVGGVDRGGILVKAGKELTSAAEDARLSTGALVEELQFADERLHYKLLQGHGPEEGWISVKLPGKDLAVKTDKRPEGAQGTMVESSSEELALKPENLSLVDASSAARIIPQYKGPVSAPPGSKPTYKPQVMAMIQQLKAAGIPIDENNPEQVREMIKMVQESQKKAKSQLVKQEDALPGRSEIMKISDKHYVLGKPMRGPWPKGFQVIIFANGCYWGSEKGIWRLPGGGIHCTAVGFAGGFTPNPTYEEACSGRTGHTEAVQAVFDPSKISLVDVLRWFWESHDPTQGMGQGNDRGTQYRSALYYFDDDQRQIFEATKAAYEAALKAKGKGQGQEITTEIRSVTDFREPFYYAEDHHQQYLAKPGARPYCSAQPQEVALPPFEEWAPAALKQKYRPKLSEAFWKKHGPTPHCVVKAPNEPISWP